MLAFLETTFNLDLKDAKLAFNRYLDSLPPAVAMESMPAEERHDCVAVATPEIIRIEHDGALDNVTAHWSDGFENTINLRNYSADYRKGASLFHSTSDSSKILRELMHEARFGNGSQG